MRHRAVLAWLAVLALCVVVLTRIHLASDMSAFLPRAASPSQQILVDQLHEGVASRLILVGVEGAPRAALAALNKALAARLRDWPALVLVANGEMDGLSRDRDYLWRNRYLLSPAVTADRFTAEGLRAALLDDIDLLRSQAGLLVKDMLPHDPTGEMLGLIDLLAGGAHPASSAGVWFSPDFSRTLMMLQTKAPGFDIDAQEAVYERLNALFEEVRAGVPQAASARLLASGPGIFAIKSRAQIKSDALIFSLIATGLVSLLLLAAYRAPRVLVLGLLPVASGALAGVATVGLVFGSVHGITLGFGVTLIGEAVDYAVYLFSRTTAQSPPRATIKRIWPTLRLGFVTSVVGFGAMLLSGFDGFVQLGLFTIAGLLMAAAVTRYVLPAFLPEGFCARTGAAAAVLTAILKAAPSLRLAVLALAIAAVAVLALHRGPFWEGEIESMNPVPKAEILLDQSLRRDIGAPDMRYMLMADTDTLERALAVSDTLVRVLTPLVEDGALEGFDAPSLYLPGEAAQRARQQALPAPDVLAANLKQAAAGLPFRADLFAPFLADAQTARAAPLLRPESLDGTALGLKLHSMLIARPAGWTVMVPLRGVEDLPAIAAPVRALSLARVDVLDLNAESDRLLASYLREAQTLALIGGGAIAALLAFALRSARRLAAVLAPLAASVLVTSALIILIHKEMSIFNLLGLLLVVAVGSNYTLFFEQETLGGDEGGRVLASLVLANLCAVTGFGVLSFSGIAILQGIGMTVAIGTLLSLLFGAVLSAPKRTPRSAPS